MPTQWESKTKEINQKCSEAWKANSSQERRELKADWEWAARKIGDIQAGGWCLRFLIAFVYMTGSAIINADKLGCLQITDSVVPLILGIRKLLWRSANKGDSLWGFWKPTSWIKHSSYSKWNLGTWMKLLQRDFFFLHLLLDDTIFPPVIFVLKINHFRLKWVSGPNSYQKGAWL